AQVMCGLTRHGGGWVLHTIGTPSDGGGKSYDPILRSLSERQDFHLNWERRRDLVKLRVLYKTGRMSQISDSDFAELLQVVLDMPLALFQLLMKWL
ncbi:unnamed protein product, partial [Polarella glacialis]